RPAAARRLVARGRAGARPRRRFGLAPARPAGHRARRGRRRRRGAGRRPAARPARRAAGAGGPRAVARGGRRAPASAAAGRAARGAVPRARRRKGESPPGGAPARHMGFDALRLAADFALHGLPVVDCPYLLAPGELAHLVTGATLVEPTGPGGGTRAGVPPAH